MTVNFLNIKIEHIEYKTNTLQLVFMTVILTFQRSIFYQFANGKLFVEILLYYSVV